MKHRGAINPSKLLVGGLVGGAILLMVVLWATYFRAEGDQKLLAEIRCDSLLPTMVELQGRKYPISRDTICALLRDMAVMTPTGDSYDNREEDPWHYYGRMPIFPENDVWFLVFIARKSSGFKPLFSLHHRRGGGWSVVGQFEAEPVLKKLGMWEKIDRDLLRSPESLTPTDENADLSY